MYDGIDDDDVMNDVTGMIVETVAGAALGRYEQRGARLQRLRRSADGEPDARLLPRTSGHGHAVPGIVPRLVRPGTRPHAHRFIFGRSVPLLWSNRNTGRFDQFINRSTSQMTQQLSFLFFQNGISPSFLFLFFFCFVLNLTLINELFPGDRLKNLKLTILSKECSTIGGNCAESILHLKDWRMNWSAFDFVHFFFACVCVTIVDGFNQRNVTCSC